MSEQINNGGPAFPVAGTKNSVFGPHEVVESIGMTLRDYFAAKAIIGILGNPKAMDAAARHSVDNNQDMSVSVTNMCYRYADAMLCAREAK